MQITMKLEATWKIYNSNLRTSYSFFNRISLKLMKVVANVGNPPVCSGGIAVPSGPKSRTLTVILAVFAAQPRWRHKP